MVLTAILTGRQSVKNLQCLYSGLHAITKVTKNKNKQIIATGQ